LTNNSTHVLINTGIKNMSKTFGETLREQRRLKNISQRELAEKVGVDFSYISKVENDRLPPPSADTIVKICKILEIESDILLALTGKIPSETKQMLSSSIEAQKFIKQAQEMNLSDDEWQTLTKGLKRLRS
jgi:HTH-type transcriptional regulator, competence development regulator